MPVLTTNYLLFKSNVMIETNPHTEVTDHCRFWGSAIVCMVRNLRQDQDVKQPRLTEHKPAYS